MTRKFFSLFGTTCLKNSGVSFGLALGDEFVFSKLALRRSHSGLKKVKEVVDGRAFGVCVCGLKLNFDEN